MSVYILADLDRIGVECPKCKTEVIFRADSPMDVVVHQQCPACGEVIQDQTKCVHLYRSLFQSPCSKNLRLYSK
jgi:predicted RNA-binding Zn-ribbon protein involved in translation (DUF1610 family)